MVQAFLEHARQALLGHALQPLANGTHVANVATASSSSDAPVPQNSLVTLLYTVDDVLTEFKHELRREISTGELADTPMWGLGIGLMVVGTVASSVGMLCFKRAGTMTSTPWYQNSWFWGGLVLFVMTAAVLDTIVFAVTPLGLIAPFAGLTIVVSFALASFGCCGVNEPPTRTTTSAVVLIVIGVTVCAVFGPKSDGTINPTQLQEIFRVHRLLYVLCAIAGPSFLIFYAVSLYKPAETRKALRSWVGALVLALSAALFGAVTQLQFKALAHAIVTVLGVMSSADSNTEHWSSLYPSTVMCVVQLLCAASTGLAQIGFLNFAISGAPVAYTVPAYQSALLVFTLGTSGLMLDEYVNESILDQSMFWSAAGVIILGMLLNAWGLSRATRAKGASGGGAAGEGSDDESPGAVASEAALLGATEAALIGAKEAALLSAPEGASFGAGAASAKNA